MARGGKSRRSTRYIQNVRVVDRDESQDSLRMSRMLTEMSNSNSQVRVQCGYQGTLTPAAQVGGIVGFTELEGTDDWASFTGQYTEFRVVGMQFRIFDNQPSAPAINLWATFHQQGGTVPTGVNDVVDRVDARVVPPGTGWVELVWAAHGQPEMEFQSVTNYTGYGGLVYNINPATTLTGTKYQIIAKFVVDFRGRK